MEWVIWFIASWILFFLLIDWKKIHINIWSGLVVSVIQLCLDAEAIRYNLYFIEHQIIDLWGSSLFFTLGPVFVIGVLFAQYHPNRRTLILANVIVITILYSSMEMAIVLNKAVVYENWAWFDSLGVNLSIMIILSWFSMVILHKKEGSMYEYSSIHRDNNSN